jgi:TP901-1 family phage major tail protein
MDKPVHGKHKILLFRIEGDSDNAWRLPYQTEHSFSESRDFESTPTKDGSILSPGEYEGTVSITALQKVGDDQLKNLKSQVRSDNPDRIELWEIDVTDLEGETVPSTRAKAYINSIEGSNPSDGSVEYSIELQVDGKPRDMAVDVTPALLEIVELTEQETTEEQPTAGE